MVLTGCYTALLNISFLVKSNYLECIVQLFLSTLDIISLLYRCIPTQAAVTKYKMERERERKGERVGNLSRTKVCVFLCATTEREDDFSLQVRVTVVCVAMPRVCVCRGV